MASLKLPKMESLPSLPSEIMEQILLKLPPKSLIRFLVVSKPLFAQITDPKFIKQYLNQNLNNHHLLLVFSSSLHSSPLKINFNFSPINHCIKLPNNPRFSSFRFLGSCNGLVCLSDRTDVILFNPAIRRHHILPRLMGELEGQEDLYLRNSIFGFGYDSENGDYKVVKIVKGVIPMKGMHNCSRAYSLKSNSWKNLAAFPYFLSDDLPDGNGVFLNDQLHFSVCGIDSDIESLLIGRFDVLNEGYTSLDFPRRREGYRGSWIVGIGDSGGQLCCLFNYPFMVCADVWCMKEYGDKESWTRLLTLDRSMESAVIMNANKIVALSCDGNKILIRENSILFWYDVRDKKCVQADMPHGFLGWYEPGIIVDSLELLDHYKPDCHFT